MLQKSQILVQTLSNGLVVSALGLQGPLSLSSFTGWSNEYQRTTNRGSDYSKEPEIQYI